MKTIQIDGNAFSDINGFYDEIQRKFCPGFEGFGRNLDALNDVLRGGYGVFDLGEVVGVEWLNSAKSRQDLSARTSHGEASLFDQIVDIFNRQQAEGDGSRHLTLTLR